MNAFKKFLIALPLALGLSVAQAAAGGYPLDHFPTGKLTEQAALQNGAKLFVNFCLNCHGASSMRYNRLMDIGLSEEQIKKNLLFSADKVGEPMKISMDPVDAKVWFGAQPPDLSVIARARASGAGSGADWLYTYLRAYYRDASRPIGWNNAVFPSVGMPHVLWEMQGSRGATIEDIKAVKDEGGATTGFQKIVVSFDTDGNRTEVKEKVDGHPHEGTTVTLGKAEGGSLSAARYDEEVADLVAYITFMSDPSAQARTRMGVWVLLFLAFFTVLAWWMNKEYWKDIK
ncbi:cytochrome c1 [Quisquiliibacterium transsilvanicum]|uniref:Ubiquinol-cytochrome c reductase cytochrome c1 subunit n=1 Tax=Quisquiliibacterium transsilvanicum TaxID=1549638 RepID=A0A7W8HL13_9BURK|nr:cytochrome c1 [Quisquiliibacterium transsilvanicum]MBB5273060.1 ubiquinol-cytochrome c reductase cytochrome c1 subunit [Quisquiliibacterium transsilvanicum]